MHWCELGNKWHKEVKSFSSKNLQYIGRNMVYANVTMQKCMKYITNIMEIEEKMRSCLNDS